MLDDVVDVSAGQDEEGDGVERLWVGRAWAAQVSSENLAGLACQVVMGNVAEQMAARSMSPSLWLGVCRDSCVQ